MQNKILIFEYKYNEIHFYLRIYKATQKNGQNNKHPKSGYYVYFVFLEKL